MVFDACECEGSPKRVLVDAEGLRIKQCDLCKGIVLEGHAAVAAKSILEYYFAVARKNTDISLSDVVHATGSDYRTVRKYLDFLSDGRAEPLKGLLPPERQVLSLRRIQLDRYEYHVDPGLTGVVHCGTCQEPFVSDVGHARGCPTCESLQLLCFCGKSRSLQQNLSEDQIDWCDCGVAWTVKSLARWWGESLWALFTLWPSPTDQVERHLGSRQGDDLESIAKEFGPFAQSNVQLVEPPARGPIWFY